MCGCNKYESGCECEPGIDEGFLAFIKSLVLTVIIVVSAFYICELSNAEGFSFLMKIAFPSVILLMGADAFPVIFNLLVVGFIIFMRIYRDDIAKVLAIVE